jgi:hypothetical protein
VPGGAFDHATLDLLDQRIEVEMLTPRRDGSISSRPIWVVVVDGTPYVRSYRGPSGIWYRRALEKGGAAIAVDGQTIEFSVEPVHDDELNRRISDAFEAKYPSSGATPTMIAPEVVATTLRLIP